MPWLIAYQTTTGEGIASTTSCIDTAAHPPSGADLQTPPPMPPSSVRYHPTTRRQTAKDARAASSLAVVGRATPRCCSHSATLRRRLQSVHAYSTNEQSSNCKVKTITPSDCGVSFAHPQVDVWDDSWMVETTVQTVRHTRGQEPRTVPPLPLPARWSQGASRPRSADPSWSPPCASTAPPAHLFDFEPTR
jgi:hypothetical protein